MIVRIDWNGGKPAAAVVKNKILLSADCGSFGSPIANDDFAPKAVIGFSGLKSMMPVQGGLAAPRMRYSLSAGRLYDMPMERPFGAVSSWRLNLV